MRAYIVRRVFQAIPVILIATFVVFMTVHFIPGDPALMLVGEDATPELLEEIREEMGLNKPLLQRYASWLFNMVRGDMGKSLLSRMQVSQLIGFALPATMLLTLAVIIVALVIGIPLGILLAYKNGTTFDVVVTVFQGVLLALPNFWLGILLILIFSVELRWLPSTGYIPFFENPLLAIKFLILPVIALGSRLTAEISRFVKHSMLETLKEDYVRTARAKGIPMVKILFKHVLRNALVPITSMIGVRFGALLGGTVIVETVFSWPGIGRLIVQAVGNRDYPVMLAGLVILIVMFVIVNLATDLLYGKIDPRISIEGGAK